jgi:hypothetical protein
VFHPIRQYERLPNRAPDSLIAPPGCLIAHLSELPFTNAKSNPSNFFKILKYN